jgi:hypothetical protein
MVEPVTIAPDAFINPAKRAPDPAVRKQKRVSWLKVVPAYGVRFGITFRFDESGSFGNIASVPGPGRN